MMVALTAELERVNAFIGFQLRARRLAAAMSGERLAGRLKISTARLEAWEAGREGPTLLQLLAVAKILRVPLGYFFAELPPARVGRRVDDGARRLGARGEERPRLPC